MIEGVKDKLKPCTSKCVALVLISFALKFLACENRLLWYIKQVLHPQILIHGASQEERMIMVVCAPTAWTKIDHRPEDSKAEGCLCLSVGEENFVP